MGAAKHFHESEPKAKLTFSLLPEVEVSCWRIGQKKVIYKNDERHTLSLYINGGYKSFRSDYRGVLGKPNRFCLMPQAEESYWYVNSAVEFVHMYFSDQAIKQFVAMTYDKDIRSLELHEWVYRKNSKLHSLFKLIGNKRLQINDLQKQIWTYELFNGLLDEFGFVNEHKLIQGLSMPQLKKVKSFIADNIANTLTIELIAEQIFMSPFHFSRCFKNSTGFSVAKFVQRIRLEKVKQLLNGKHSLSEISLLTGFSHQSHMTQGFKLAFGLTPNTFRKQLS